MEWHVVCSLSVVAWQTKDTSLQPTDREVYRRDSEEICGSSGDKKKRQSEEIENKIKAVHRGVTRTYPVYHDCGCRDGTTGDVHRFSKSFNQNPFKSVCRNREHQNFRD